MFLKALLLLQSADVVCACLSHQVNLDVSNIIKHNQLARSTSNITSHRSEKFAITNVSVFDGYEMLSPRTVIIDNGHIGSDIRGARLINGRGQFLLPGLIDSHCHPNNVADLQKLTRYGVTSALVMACPSPSLCASLRNHTGLTDVLTSSFPAAAVNSAHGRLLHLNASTTITNASQASSWVQTQVDAGADFIKLIAETPGLNQSILTAATKVSHAKHKTVVCHAADYGSVQQALTAEADQVHHVPLDRAIDLQTAQTYLAGHHISVPTLIMMQATAQNFPQLNFSAAVASASILHSVNVPILAGTDANGGSGQVGTPGAPLFGSSMHDELELLVQAGLSPIEALRSATSHPARIWGWVDRGRVEVGKRADLVLVGGDPTLNISNTRNIRMVWVEGREFPLTMGDA